MTWGCGRTTGSRPQRRLISAAAPGVRVITSSAAGTARPGARRAPAGRRGADCAGRGRCRRAACPSRRVRHERGSASTGGVEAELHVDDVELRGCPPTQPGRASPAATTRWSLGRRTAAGRPGARRSSPSGSAEVTHVDVVGRHRRHAHDPTREHAGRTSSPDPAPSTGRDHPPCHPSRLHDRSGTPPRRSVNRPTRTSAGPRRYPGCAYLGNRVAAHARARASIPSPVGELSAAPRPLHRPPPVPE